MAKNSGNIEACKGYGHERNVGNQLGMKQLQPFRNKDQKNVLKVSRKFQVFIY